ncbi:MAG: ABC transporter permease [Chloroflexi bacterium]|nr:ABC transporter permease [Chloroflexota bacterium]MCL5275657.1 ABC transporter permease [Chloroflexota bacterium]
MKTVLIALLSETRKGFMIAWSYKFNLLMSMLSLSVIFLGISFMLGNGQLNSSAMASTLLGYLIWFYAITAIENMSYQLRDEMQCGQLEQLYMSPAPPQLLLLGRAISTLIISTIQVMIMGGVMIAAFGIPIPMRLEGLPVFALTMGGLYGFGYALGGATLIFKQTGPLANMLTNALLFINGAILPVDRLPDWLQTLAKILPSTQGILVLRKVILDAQPLATVWADGSLILLVIHSAAFFAVGWFVYKWCESVAKRQGSLGQY